MEDENLQVNLLKECLRKQLDEFHMLLSIFCNPGELHVDDYSFVDNINSYIEGETARLNAKLDYQLNLPLLEGEKVQIRIELPHFYPGIEIPIFVVRSACFPRDQERMITERIERFIEREVLDPSEAYVYQVISWIQDNFEELIRFEENVKPSDHEHNGSNKSDDSATFERLWIYSHHLKSKTKRQTILKTAKDLELTGFSRPGKPAIICVEGHQKDTQEFWRTIRPLKWQKIQVRLAETEMVDTPISFDDNRRFVGFREELLTELSNENEEEVPMSMSLFMKFLDRHDSGYIRKELFGFEQVDGVL
ncbi:RWD domain-containing protein 2A [Toxorhynchites rutilus septentrionalis]|uniref:RWD domain-containing protein 2A n=1 Tax=Toxorhynchites rutilus septentrionalis TaxID=329112 RepID=UPI0024796C62|nr:RWD domain-containing protein 2A [Toxorhynchites rutilus septentrionalis]XP_055631066.1 RWD domain-containing protein 2A [Toxorhynchites rutilus septentrionalis]